VIFAAALGHLAPYSAAKAFAAASACALSSACQISASAALAPLDHHDELVPRGPRLVLRRHEASWDPYRTKSAGRTDPGVP
jgi:hypothetical protein